jgi:hypothetical protein
MVMIGKARRGEKDEQSKGMYSPAALIEGMSQLMTPLMYARSAHYNGYERKDKCHDEWVAVSDSADMKMTRMALSQPPDAAHNREVSVASPPHSTPRCTSNHTPVTALFLSQFTYLPGSDLSHFIRGRQPSSPSSDLLYARRIAPCSTIDSVHLCASVEYDSSGRVEKGRGE